MQGIGFLASICGFAWFSHVKMQQLTNSKDSGRFAVANMQHCSSFDPEGQHYLQAHLQEGEVVPCEPRLSRLRTHRWLCAGVKRDGKDEQKDQLSNLCKSLAWGLTWFALGACICLLSGETQLHWCLLRGLLQLVKPHAALANVLRLSRFHCQPLSGTPFLLEWSQRVRHMLFLW